MSALSKMNSYLKGVGLFFERLGSKELQKQRKIVYLALELLSLIGLFILFYSPICTANAMTETGVKNFRITPAFLFKNIKLNIASLLAFAPVQLIMLLLVALFMILVVHRIIRSLITVSVEDDLAQHARAAVLLSGVGIFVYTLVAYFFSPINVALGGFSKSAVNFFPLVFIALITLLLAILTGAVVSAKRKSGDASALFRRKEESERKRLLRRLFVHQLELLLFALAAAAVAVYSMLIDIVKVDFTSRMVNIPDFIFSGRKFLFESTSLETQNERLLSFLLSAVFILTVLFAFLSVVSFFSRSTLCTKLTIGAIIASSVSSALVSLFGLYYKIVQTMNEEILARILKQYSISSKDLISYKAESTAYVYFLILLAVLVVCFIRRPYSKASAIEKKIYSSELSILAPEVSIASPATGDGPSESFDPLEPTVTPVPDTAVGYFDPCPAFTEIDLQIPRIRAALEEKRQALFESPTLPRLVDFIVQYARDCRLHLFYTPQSIAAFLAGLGATRLTILQGMSGTGKTSLPKIVAEALSSVCDIVEVESSWRDKNELLGYYNEFTKVYTPKKFTQALYRAALDPDTLTFIVLDEMNLSRIEYYFSDFLSLMENEPDKRSLKLLNVPLYRQSGDRSERYLGLAGGHTLRIPPNVWFIGTANRDESTYDISDKVYDRAHTMNFDRRAPKPQYYSEPIAARYLPAGTLLELLEAAKTGVRFDIDSYPLVAKVEKLLAPYNISFGNRIAMQIESFVKIYASCFAMTDAVINEALETILLSKVVKKLELKSVENKEELAAEFEKLQLGRCAKFIAELSED